MNFGWQNEPEPPSAQGVIGVGAVARRLFAVIEERLRTAPPSLMVSANDDLLILTGPTMELPWVDGAQYIAPREEAQAIWLPTAQRPTLPLDLIARATRRLHLQSPLLLMPVPARLVPLTLLLPISDGLLRQIRARWGAE